MASSLASLSRPCHCPSVFCQDLPWGHRSLEGPLAAVAGLVSGGPRAEPFWRGEPRGAPGPPFSLACPPEVVHSVKGAPCETGSFPGDCGDHRSEELSRCPSSTSWEPVWAAAHRDPQEWAGSRGPSDRDAESRPWLCTQGHSPAPRTCVSTSVLSLVSLCCRRDAEASELPGALNPVALLVLCRVEPPPGSPSHQGPLTLLWPPGSGFSRSNRAASLTPCAHLSPHETLGRKHWAVCPKVESQRCGVGSSWTLTNSLPPKCSCTSCPHGFTVLLTHDFPGPPPCWGCRAGRAPLLCVVLCFPYYGVGQSCSQISDCTDRREL